MRAKKRTDACRNVSTYRHVVDCVDKQPTNHASNHAAENTDNCITKPLFSVDDPAGESEESYDERDEYYEYK